MKLRVAKLAGLLASLTAVVLTASAAVHERNLEKSFEVKPGGKLLIKVDQGSVVVATGEAERVQVHVFHKVNGGSKARAEELFANHEVTFGQDGNTVSVMVKTLKQQGVSWSFGEPGLEASYQVNIPRKFNVELHTAGGDI